MKHRIFILLFLLGVLGLFLYSFTQIDLSLTLSKVSLWQEIQKTFQYIGYFQRPLSTVFFISILFILYIAFMGVLNTYHNLSISNFWKILAVVVILLGIAYNAFSYDLFNYIFDAKIITQYQQNPYEHKALDYPGDPMLSFMRWTHRVYPYGPLWLFLTVPISFIGFQYFLPTFFMFKALMAFSYIGTCYVIQKIREKVLPKEKLYGVVLFAFCPLVLIEAVVSAHNDIVMLFFAMCSVLFLIQKRFIWAVIFCLISVGIKFATVFLLPLILTVWYMEKRGKTIEWGKVFLAMSVVMIAAVIVASVRTNFQPWYLLYPLPFIALLPKRYNLTLPIVVMTLFALLEYAPFLYFGNWDRPVPAILAGLTFGGAVLAFFTMLVSVVGKRAEK